MIANPKYLLCIVSLFLANAASAVTLTVTPPSIDRLSAKEIVLHVAGITAGQAVTIDRFADSNGNGIVDRQDLFLQRMAVTDNAPFTIGGVVVSSVPGDSDVASGSMDIKLVFAAGSEAERASGHFIFRATAGTQTADAAFTIVEPVLTQTVKGVLTAGGNPVGGAVVALLKQEGDNQRFVAGAFSDGSGNFSINADPGNYALIALKPGFYGSFNQAPPVALAQNQTVTQNLAINQGTGPTIAVSYFDAENPTLPLPGLQTFLTSDVGIYAVAVSGTDGKFTVSLPAGNWRVQPNNVDIIAQGYLSPQDDLQTSTANGSNATLNAGFHKATAVIYGSIKNAQNNNPLAGPFRLSVHDNNGAGEYELHPFTDPAGHYAVGVLAGTWEVSSSDNENPAAAGYVITSSHDISMAAGQAVKANLFAQTANRLITGTVKDKSNNPVAGLGVYANAFLGNEDYNANVNTDSNGAFSIGVTDGTWNVGLDSQGLADMGFASVQNQTVTVSGGNATVNFVVGAPSAHIRGRVLQNGVGQGGFQVVAFQNGPSVQANTDSNGNFDLGVNGGVWIVQLSDNSAQSHGVIGPSVQVSVPDGGSATQDLVVQAANRNITGSLKTSKGDPIGSVIIHASVIKSGITYGNNTRTDANGNFQIHVFSGIWQVGPDSVDLNSQGYPNIDWQNVDVTNGDASVVFVAVVSIAEPPSLSAPQRLADGHFQFTISDTTSSTLKIQRSSDLKSWGEVGSMSSPGAPFVFTDNSPEPSDNSFYRVVRQ
jgi:hypothetical protein